MPDRFIETIHSPREVAPKGGAGSGVSMCRPGKGCDARPEPAVCRISCASARLRSVRAPRCVRRKVQVIQPLVAGARHDATDESLSRCRRPVAVWSMQLGRVRLVSLWIVACGCTEFGFTPEGASEVDAERSSSAEADVEPASDSAEPSETKGGSGARADKKTVALSAPRFNSLLWQVRRQGFSTEGCDEGDVVQCFEIGNSYERSGSRHRAFQFYRKACKLWRQDPQPCTIGLNERKDRNHSPHTIACRLPYDGEQSAVDYAHMCVGHCHGEEACEALLERRCLMDAEACRRDCSRGEAAYCRVLARMHTEGLGVPENPDKGAALFKAACEAGDRWSCNPTARFHSKAKVMPETVP